LIISNFSHIFFINRKGKNNVAKIIKKWIKEINTLIFSDVKKCDYNFFIPLHYQISMNKKMSTLTLDRPKRKLQQQKVVLNVATRKYNFFMELLKNFNFVQVEENDDDSREEIIANLKEAAKDLKLLKAGKLETRPLNDFLNEL